MYKMFVFWSTIVWVDQLHGVVWELKYVFYSQYMVLASAVEFSVVMMLPYSVVTWLSCHIAMLPYFEGQSLRNQQ
jgi:hypothetical protein